LRIIECEDRQHQIFFNSLEIQDALAQATEDLHYPKKKDLRATFDAANNGNCQTKLQMALAKHMLDPDKKLCGTASSQLDKIQRIMKLESMKDIDALTREETIGCTRIHLAALNRIRSFISSGPTRPSKSGVIGKPITIVLHTL
jgi:hypothetical protein